MATRLPVLQVARFGRPTKVLDVTFAPLVHHPDAYGVLTRREKLRITIADASQAVHLSHAIDGPVFRVIAQAVVADRFGTVAETDPQTPGLLAWADFKGWVRDSQAVSNRLRLLFDPRQREPWSIQIAEGPGQVIGAGAVKPAGAPRARAAFTLTRTEMLALCLQGLEALAAFTHLCLRRVADDAAAR